MKKITLAALALMSTSALATDARVAAHQGNAAFADSSDYRTYYSLTDNGKDSVYFDLMAPMCMDVEIPAVDDDSEPTTETVCSNPMMSGAFRKNGHSLHVSQIQDDAGEDAGTSMKYFAADGDSGYSASLDLINLENFGVGGGYGMSDGDKDMAFGASFTKAGEDIGITAGVASRTLGEDDVTVWGAGVNYGGVVDEESGATGTTVGGNYGMGWRYSADRSKAGVTVGPSLSLGLPEEGDPIIGLNLAEVNVAGEFALNDWFGLRGSITSGLALVDPTGDLDVSTAGMGAAFGASIDFEGADVDLVVDPGNVMNGPYFLTGAASSPAVMMSARFDI